MKQGQKLETLALELKRQAQAKRDFLVDTPRIEVLPPAERGTGSRVSLSPGPDADSMSYGLSRHTLRQMGTDYGIPAKYLDRMEQDHPALFAENLNSWFRHEPRRRMLRTLDGGARAFLSDRFRPLDNADLVQAILPPVLDTGARVQSCEVTDRRLYIKAVLADLTAEPVVGDPISIGIQISNSEIGCGSVDLSVFVLRLVCMNGMKSSTMLRQIHAGRRHSSDLEIAELSEVYSDRTRQLDDATLWSKCRDAARHILSPACLDKVSSKIQAAAEGEPVKLPVPAVQEVTNRFQLTEGESSNVLENLIKGGDYSRWGMLNAVTAAAEAVPDYDRASELESIGGSILELKPTDWNKIATAEAA